MNKTRLLIWMIASVAAGTVFYDLLPDWRHWWYVLQIWIQGENPYKSFPFWVLPGTIFLNLVLVFKLIASYGLFRFRSWGRTLAIYILSTDFISRLAGFVNVQTSHWRHPELIQRYNEWVASHPNTQSITISFIPGYIIGLLSLISVIILMVKPVKEKFRKNAIEADRSESA
jgi:hypothetical protein